MSEQKIMSIKGDNYKEGKNFTSTSTGADIKIVSNLKVEEETKEIKDYNRSIFNIEPSIENITLLGNKILIRLFKLYKTDPISGIYKPNMSYYETAGGKTATKEADLQVQFRGVVLKISEECSPQLQESLKPGMVVDLSSRTNLYQHMIWLNKKTNNIELSDYFLINENMIDWIHDVKDIDSDYIEKFI